MERSELLATRRPTKPAAHESRWRIVAALTVLLVALSVVAVWQVRAATRPDWPSSFYGGVDVVDRGPHWQTPRSGGDRVHVVVSASIDEDPLSGSPNLDDLDMMLISFGSPGEERSVAGDELVVTVYGDAMPIRSSDVRPADTGTPVDFRLTQPPGGDRSLGFTVRIPADALTPVAVRWRMRRPINQVGGRLVTMRYPGCTFEPPLAGCDVGGSFVGVDEAINYADPPLTDPRIPHWSDDAAAHSPYLVLTDGHLADVQELRLFVLGVILGVAGGALVELIIRLIPYARSKDFSLERGGTSGKDTPNLVEARKAPAVADLPVGERWEQWKRSADQRRSIE